MNSLRIAILGDNACLSAVNGIVQADLNLAIVFSATDPVEFARKFNLLQRPDIIVMKQIKY